MPVALTETAISKAVRRLLALGALNSATLAAPA